MSPSFTRAETMKVPFRRDMASQAFVGIRSICAYMRIGPSTFYTWTQGYNFPATRTPDGRWMTCTALIDRWIEDRLEQERQTVMPHEGSADHE